MEKMENWKTLINKKAKIIFEDGENHFSKKEGIIIEFTPTHLILKTGSFNEAVNLIKILRIEEIKNG
jgi:hypothetical protein